MEKQVSDSYSELLGTLRQQVEKTRSLEWRDESLRRLDLVIRKYENQITAALFKDLGKSEFEAFATEIGFILEEIAVARREFRTWSAVKRLSTPLKLWPSRSEIFVVPKGAVLILAPWNYPFQLAIAPLVAAVAAGNACAVKPSELAPTVAEILQKIIGEVWPDREVVCVQGDADASARLIDRRWDHVFFTGGTEIGRKVMMTCAKYLTPVTLELGGKSPCVIDRDIDLEVASRRVMWGKTINAGQTCIAPDYLVVHRDVREKFVDALKARAAEFFGSDPLASKSYGKIISTKHFARLDRLLDKAEILYGGQRDASSLRFAPTLVDVLGDVDHPLLNEEIFGPILPIVTWSTRVELEAILDRHPRPLAFYVFSRDLAFARELMRDRLFGGGAINDTLMHIAHGEMPFGGIGESGMGAYHGQFGFETFSHQKAVVTRGFRFDAKIRYAPYGEAWKKLKRFM